MENSGIPTAGTKDTADTTPREQHTHAHPSRDRWPRTPRYANDRGQRSRHPQSPPRASRSLIEESACVVEATFACVKSAQAVQRLFSRLNAAARNLLDVADREGFPAPAVMREIEAGLLKHGMVCARFTQTTAVYSDGLTLVLEPSLKVFLGAMGFGAKPEHVIALRRTNRAPTPPTPAA